MAVYEGNEKYIFVSYAHKDTPTVLPIIEALQNAGFRVWYDGGIEAGTEWPEYIADHLSVCGVALIFISENAIASKNCIREINFAISEGREMLAVYLSDVKLTSGMRMQLGTIQAMYYNRFLDSDSFVSALCGARILQKCRDGASFADDINEVEEDDEDLSAFFGVQKQKRAAAKKSVDDFSDEFPIKIHRGSVTEEKRAEITENARIMNRLFNDSHVKALVNEVEIGPRVTTYYVRFERGIRVTKLESFVEDLKFSLAVDEVRCVFSPQKSRVGFELLNPNQEVVPLEELLKEARLREEMNIETRTDTAVPLGRDTAGNAIFGDIAKFPHLLLAGMTQTGKTTFLHSMIVSMITRVPKERLRLVLVDLKGVEFDVYDKIPHMLLPVIHDSASAARTLSWLVEEMETRYTAFIQQHVRNIDDYNKLADEGKVLAMPRIIFVVDDYADLVYRYQKDIENSVMRLSQKARAAGIHVILSTQRADPSTITGVIKANMPSRLAFKTMGKVDSRCIIDSDDATELNNQGDIILALVGESSAKRIHTPYISFEKIESIVNRLIKRDGEAVYHDPVINVVKNEAMPTSSDTLFDKVVEDVIKNRRVSTSYIQRAFGVGYSKAADIIERLEDLGIISSANGSKPRIVLITEEQWTRMKRGESNEEIDGNVQNGTDPASIAQSGSAQGDGNPDGDDVAIYAAPSYEGYALPSPEVLSKSEVPTEDEPDEIRKNADIIIDTLASFNIEATLKGVDRGPRITRYEIAPARGVPIKRIINLVDDICLNLSVAGIRVEAPIPGRSTVGFEVPNKTAQFVLLRELLESEEFINAPSRTFVCIGRNVGGDPVFADIAEFPNAIVAGATGMGKSVVINSMIASILCKARPDEVKLLLIDPKTVEYRPYRDIPHLLAPIITDVREAENALTFIIDELDRRYAILEKHQVRSLDHYNEKQANDPSIGIHIPKIIIFIDELADLVAFKKEAFNDLIAKISQKGRAAGVYMVMGTQRPSVDVISGTIKMSAPVRMCLRVISQVDSRTVLDSNTGAERLLDKGDMLYLSKGSATPVRVQGAYISDSEVEALCEQVTDQVGRVYYDPRIIERIKSRPSEESKAKAVSSALWNESGDPNDSDDYHDPQFLDAVDIAIYMGKVSTSMLQRKLSIGFGRAARYIDMMEKIGLVSEANGPKPREVLVTPEEWERIHKNNEDTDDE